MHRRQIVTCGKEVTTVVFRSGPAEAWGGKGPMQHRTESISEIP
jgi:hypothetical protein